MSRIENLVMVGYFEWEKKSATVKITNRGNAILQEEINS